MVITLLVSYLIPELERLAHNFVNEERVKRGLKPLNFDTLLLKPARSHSKDMFMRNYFSHISPEGYDPEDRLRRFGIKCDYTGENIFMGYTIKRISTDTIYYTKEEIARNMVSSWMKSKGHRRNILNPKYRRQAIGIYIRDSKIYATQLFCD